MNRQYPMPPHPQHAVLKRIYPWDEYDFTLVMTWLYAQAQKTGFTGTFDEFKLHYGENIEPTDPASLVEKYTGAYHITPLVDLVQVLQTKNKLLEENVIIDAIPQSIIEKHEQYQGNYQITPLAHLDQILRTSNKVMEQNITIEKIPYQTTSNTAGGYTAIIG